MRPVTGAETTVLESAAYAPHLRVHVENADGTFIDLSSRVVECRVTEDIDQPVASATITFFRREGNASLAPLDFLSTLNVDDSSAYSPLLASRRQVKVWAATTTVGSTPISTDWKPIFHGRIDTVDWPGLTSRATIQCRDLGGVLEDAYIETELKLPTAGNTRADRVISTIMFVAGQGASFDVRNVLNSATFTPEIGEYQQEPMPALEAARRVAKAIAWEFRYLFDSGTGTYRATLYSPDRTKTTADYTWGPGQYIDVTEMSIDIAPVRNKIKVEYFDAQNQIRSVTGTDTDSVNLFGTRFMLLAEDAKSPIQTEAQATAFLNGILNDLRDPKATHAITRFLWWPVELGDVYNFSPNAEQYDETQQYAVTGFTHQFTSGEGAWTARTTITTRGTPAGAYYDWLRGERRIKDFVPGGEDIEADSTSRSLTNFREHRRTLTDVTFRCLPGSLVRRVALTWDEFDQSADLDPWLDLGANVRRWVDVPSPGTAEIEFTIPLPEPGKITYLQAEPRLDPLSESGPVQRVRIFPLAGPRIQITPFINREDGAVSAAVYGQSAESIKISFNVLEFAPTPSRAQVATQDPINKPAGGAWTPEDIGTLTFLVPGQTVSIAALGYYGANGTGAESEDLAVAYIQYDEIQEERIADGAVIAVKLGASAQKLWTDIRLSATNDTTVAWPSGTVRLADGTEYAISAGDTGVMANGTRPLYYVYLDLSVSTTAFQVSTDFADVVGDDVMLIAWARRAPSSAQKASFQQITGVGLLINSELLGDAAVTETVIADDSIASPKIKANAVVAGKVAAGAINAVDILVDNLITATKMNVTLLSAISADLGDVTAGRVRNAGTAPGEWGIRLSSGYALPTEGYIDLLPVADGGSANLMDFPGFTVTKDGEVTLTSRSSVRGVKVENDVLSFFEVVSNASGLTIGWNGSNTQIRQTPPPSPLGGDQYLIIESDGSGLGGIRLNGRLGLNGVPIAKPTVTGSRGSNAALASLLTALSNYGLITDSSS